MENEKIKNKGGRPKHKVTPESRKQVQTMAGMGLTMEMAASILEIHEDTLRLYYKEDFVKGKSKATFEVAKSLYKNATTHNNIKAQEFYLKCIAKWKDTSALEVSGPNGGAIEMSEAKSSLLSAVMKKRDDDNK